MTKGKFPKSALRIKQVLKYAKMDITDFSVKIGLPYSDPRISHMANGYYGISTKTAKKITEIYPEISFEWLVDGTGDFYAFRPTDPIHHTVKMLRNKVETLENQVEFLSKLKSKS